MSTLVELAGFACGIIAAWLAGGPVAGLAAAAVSFLFIGYALDDQAATVSARRMVAPYRRRREARRVKKENKRFREKADERDRQIRAA